jgi:hypothetical protein
MTDRKILEAIGFASLAILMGVAVVIMTCAIAARAETFRDNMGRVTGTATTRGNVTTFTNNKGQETGYAERRGNTTTIYNEKGQERGTITGRDKR